ncbi:uncharacterized protein LOC142339849 [Convolutriloba macropyga]|uniref:uncharacterized protein LOC142339849 n=1 Tax=Convolutriloba macropyga TaxID=536237 RepID=UPI003F51CC33
MFYQGVIYVAIFCTIAALLFSLCCHGNRFWLLEDYFGGMWKYCEDTSGVMGDCIDIGKEEAKILDHPMSAYNGMRFFIILCQIDGLLVVAANALNLYFRKRRFLAIGNLGLSIIFFASYLLFATIATRVFQEAFNVDTENGWIIVAMWVGWIFSVLTFICALGLLYLILNSKRSTDTVVKRVTTTHVSY